MTLDESDEDRKAIVTQLRRFEIQVKNKIGLSWEAYQTEWAE